MSLKQSFDYLRTQLIQFEDESKDKIKDMDDRIKYTIATLDAIELEKSKKMPKIENRLESTEAKL